MGTEICYGTECFYIISSDDTSVTMLAKYNLYVGYECTGDEESTCTSYGNKATGLQDSTMLGYRDDETTRRGTINFSTSSYWHNGSSLKSEYGSKYPVPVYDSNSIIYNYVENYKIYLESQGLTVEEARLITVEELEKFKCTSLCTTSPEWLYATSFWTEKAIDTNYVQGVIFMGAGMSIGIEYQLISYLGVRPVIKIPLYEFE